MEEVSDAVFNLDAVRVFLHVLSVTVWVGGQIALGAIMPALRRSNRESTLVVARAYQTVAWPAFGVALATGFWAMLDAYTDEVTAGWSRLVGIKIFVVLLSGAAALAHQRTNSSLLKAITAAIALFTALVALLMGAILTG